MDSCSLLHLLSIFFFAVNAFLGAHGNLSPNYHSRKCPQALSIIKAGVVAAIKKQDRTGASLLRLHFHDCFVNVRAVTRRFCWMMRPTLWVRKQHLLTKTPLEGLKLSITIKAELEKGCPGVVSCGDILALAARDSVVYLRGPSWKVGLGRRDSTTASRSVANTSIPSPTSDISSLLSSFSAQGLSLKDLVALLGARPIARTSLVTNTIDASFSKSLQRQCLKSGNDDNLTPLDLQTPNHFDSLYFKNLLKKKGLLQSDQALFNGSSADSLLRRCASNNFSFYKDFANAMVKMGNIRPLTGRKGEIRIDC